MTPVQAVLVAGAWWRMSSLWGEAADGRDSRRGPWVSARSQGCPSRAGPALPPPCPVKAMPSVPVTGGAGCYPAQGESVPEAALGREHPWLCCSQHHLGDLGLCSVPQLIVLSPALLPLHPPRASVSLGDTGRVVLAQPLTPSWTCRDLLPWLERHSLLSHGGTEICPPEQPAPAQVRPGNADTQWQGRRAGTALHHLLLRRHEGGPELPAASLRHRQPPSLASVAPGAKVTQREHGGLRCRPAQPGTGSALLPRSCRACRRGSR